MDQQPQLYLIAPAMMAASELGPRLISVLDAHPVACLRLPGAGDEAELGRIADIARDIAHQGNTSAASVPLALTQLIADGQARSGDKALLIAFGAGLTYAAQVVTVP